MPVLPVTFSNTHSIAADHSLEYALAQHVCLRCTLQLVDVWLVGHVIRGRHRLDVVELVLCSVVSNCWSSGSGLLMTYHQSYPLLTEVVTRGVVKSINLDRIPPYLAFSLVL